MTAAEPSEDRYVHTVSAVIPVYGGEHTLTGVVSELAAFHADQRSKGGTLYRVSQILLAYDHGRDRSDEVIRSLERQYPFVHGVWLTRNYGQHPATLAGISQSTGDWVVTMDEDGQHDPACIGDMLDRALDQQADVVYADPTNAAPHSFFRNITSWGAKFVARHLLGTNDAPKYQSFRLILGSVARTLATQSGNDTYLDVALGWIANRIATCPVALRSEGDHQSTYNLSRLLGHFWRMVFTSGTRPLRYISVIGALTSVVGIIWAIVLICIQLFSHAITVQGWTSLMVVVLIFSGLILLAIGVMAEYLGIIVHNAMGMPLYRIGDDPAKGPLGRRGNGSGE